MDKNRNTNGQFIMGHSKIEGAGRSLSLRSKLIKIVDCHVDRLDEYLNELPVDKRVQILVKLMEYTTPRLRSLDVQLESDATITIKQFLDLPAKERLKVLDGIYQGQDSDTLGELRDLQE